MGLFVNASLLAASLATDIGNKLAQSGGLFSGALRNAQLALAICEMIGIAGYG